MSRHGKLMHWHQLPCHTNSPRVRNSSFEIGKQSTQETPHVYCAGGDGDAGEADGVPAAGAGPGAGVPHRRDALLRQEARGLALRLQPARSAFVRQEFCSQCQLQPLWQQVHGPIFKLPGADTRGLSDACRCCHGGCCVAPSACCTKDRSAHSLPISAHSLPISASQQSWKPRLCICMRFGYYGSRKETSTVVPGRLRCGGGGLCANHSGGVKSCISDFIRSDKALVKPIHTSLTGSEVAEVCGGGRPNCHIGP